MNRENFNKVWKIETDDISIFRSFKNLTLDSIINNLSNELFNGQLAQEFIFKSGQNPDLLIKQKRLDGCIPSKTNFVKNSAIYNLLSTETNPLEYTFYLETILNCSKISSKSKNHIFEELKSIIDKSSYSIQLVYDGKKYHFLPLGINEFSDELIADNFIWLTKYPKSKEAYLCAFEKYKKGEYSRNLLDDLRLSLELLLKDILNNSKSLEKQKESLGQYLKPKNISVEIANMFSTLLDYFNKYQNNYIKHNDAVKDTEISFIIYLTGVFMNLLANVEK